MKKLSILISVLLSLTITLAACGHRQDEDSAATTANTVPVVAEVTGLTGETEQTLPYSETQTVTSTTQIPTSAPSVPDDSDTKNSATAGTSGTTESASSSPSGKFEVRQMNAERDGLSIYGNLYVPETQDEKLPVVILSHSANMTSDSMKSYCERIAKMGFVAYSFDFCGASPQSRSDGKQSDVTVFTEIEDLKAVLQMIKGLDFVDEQNIFLFGTSQGGLVSALTAAEIPAEIKGLILFYPAFNIPDTVQKYAKLMPSETQSPYISTLLDYDVYEHIKPYQGDVLIVHGTTDFVVPCTYSEKAAKVYKSCELHLIPGGTHGFNADNYVSFGNFDEKTWAYAESFLEEHIS